MNETINKLKYPVYQPSLTGNEKKYVMDCMDSTWISSKGKYLQKFEESFSNFIGVKYSTGVCNGTVAIYLALAAAGIQRGDEIIVPTFTYIASANPIAQIGAVPVFCDSEKESWQMSPEDAESKITSKTKAMIIPHLYGNCCDMDKITKIAHKHNLLIIEDCAEAIGTKYKGKCVGTFGDISCFSFFGNKTITTGEGGMVVSNNLELYNHAVALKTQGVSKTKEYWHDIAGYNFRMTNIEAAIGLAQLEQVEKFINQKRQIAQWYMEELKDFPFEFNKEGHDVYHTYWMVSCLLENTDMRDSFKNFLRENGIETRPTFYPATAMPMYKQDETKYPIASDIAHRGINLPSYPSLTYDNVKYICEKMKEFYKK